MLTYGFFNSLNNDRKYNADQISSMFEGLISDGVFNHVGSALEVKAGNGLSVTVGTGRAWLEDRWVKNDAIVGVQLSAASVTLSRYTAIVLRKNITDRTVSLTTIDGEAASTPVKPNIVREGDVYDICLAYVLIGPNATSISQSDITDTRADNTVCGWVTGIIEQVDTSTLFAQWETAYNEAISDMESFEDGLEAEMQEWQSGFQGDMEDWEQQMKTSFDAWLDTLTQELNVNTYVEDYYKTANFTSGTEHAVTLDMAGYTYEQSDIITAWVNGLLAKGIPAGQPSTDPDINYTIDTSGASPVLTFTQSRAASTNEPYGVVVQVIKSRIGFSS